MIVIFAALFVQHMLMKRFAAAKEKSAESRIYNIRVTAIASIPVFIAYSLLRGNNVLASIISGTVISLINMFITIGDARKQHESEQMLERDLSRIAVEDYTPSPRITSAFSQAGSSEEITSEFDPDDSAVVYVSSRSSGTKYHYSEDCIMHCKPATRGQARVAGLRPCKLCGHGDTFLPRKMLNHIIAVSTRRI